MTKPRSGKRFEMRVLAALKAELAVGRLGIEPKACQISHRKGYFSRDRGRNIVFDIVIEVTRPGANTWTFLWLFECKDYTDAVPVSDVEEFCAKVKQVAAANSKASVVASGAFQHSALAYAKANGIGLIRLLPNEQIDHVMEMLIMANPDHSTRPDVEEFSDALSTPAFRSKGRDFYALAEGHFYGSWTALLREVLRPRIL